jgi:hypothetical protein
VSRSFSFIVRERRKETVLDVYPHLAKNKFLKDATGATSNQ